MQTEDLMKFLQNEFELSETEATLYVGLLKKGPSSIMEISKFTNVNRATTHINIENIISKGLVTQSKKANGKRRIVVAEPPERLKLILEQKKMKLERAEVGLPKVIEQLSGIAKIAGTNVSEVDVKYYKGKTEVGNIYDEILRATEVRSYVNLDSQSNVFIDNPEKFIETHRKRREMKIWEIIKSSKDIDNTFVEKMDKDRYACRYLPKDVNLSSVDYVIFDGKIAVITIDENPNGIVLSNKAIYDHSVALFSFIWDMLTSGIKKSI